MTALSTPRWIAALVACWAIAANGPAQPARSADITGVYVGNYSDAQGTVTFKLALQESANGSLTGECTLDLPSASPEHANSYAVIGAFDAPSGKFDVRPTRWPTPSPPRVRMVGLAGAFEPGTGRLSGRITSGRGTFEATRDAVESANIASLVAAPNAAPVAPRVRPPAATTAPAPAQAQAQTAAQLSATAINGVYTGTYQCVDGAVKAKLSLKSTTDGSLTGFFTFDLPTWAGARPVTYKLTGRFVAGNRFPFQFTTVEPLGPPAPPAYAMTAVNAFFGVGPYVMGSDGQLHDGINLDHLKGSTPGQASVGFDTKRDEAQSADLDNVMAAQASTALAVTTTAPAVPMARLHSIDGVYNGTFDGKQGPVKFKLAIAQTGGGKLAATATVYLPADAGTKAYTYGMDGVNDPSQHRFRLAPRKGDSVPPNDFESVEFDGTFFADVAHNAARIYGAGHSGPKFEATWDAAETAEHDAAVAVQKAEEGVAYQAAMKVFNETMRNAPPKQLASNDLVRKSKAYWDNYDTDMIREVFDGGFGAAIDENKQFQRVFCTYLEMVSAKYPDRLPANHQRLSITWRLNRKFDQYNNLISEDNHDYTVDMDPRFVAKYQEAHASLTSGSEQLRGIIAAAQPGGAERRNFDMMALARDMQRFLADNGGKSAAARQMNENFLRAVGGEPSLQQAGGKIDGAGAETDLNLPPGRFARFVDGANAFYRDPANAKYRGRNDTEFCQAMAVRFEFKMSRTEEYYYANDFKARFYDQIIQPKEPSNDPNWSLLHPVVEECIAATR